MPAFANIRLFNIYRQIMQMTGLRPTFYLIIIGISLGWMIGLSESPVISSVISAILTLVVSVLVVISGAETENKDHSLKILKAKFSLLPIAIFCFSIAIVGTIGVYVRVHNLLGVDHPPTEKKEVDDKAPEVIKKEPTDETGFMGTNFLERVFEDIKFKRYKCLS
jgi:fumarate reductase subunit D